MLYPQQISCKHPCCSANKSTKRVRILHSLIIIYSTKLCSHLASSLASSTTTHCLQLSCQRCSALVVKDLVIDISVVRLRQCCLLFSVVVLQGSMCQGWSACSLFFRCQNSSLSAWLSFLPSFHSLILTLLLFLLIHTFYSVSLPPPLSHPIMWSSYVSIVSLCLPLSCFFLCLSPTRVTIVLTSLC